MDLVEDDDAFVLRADLPGLGEEDVNLELEDNVLTISGERKSEHEERREGFHRVERAYGSFSRQLTLPEGVDAEGIEAHFGKGVLEVRVPKPEERKPRKLNISGGGGGPTTIEGTESAQESGAESANAKTPA
jgi:HSP20 family protein